MIDLAPSKNKRKKIVIAGLFGNIAVQECYSQSLGLILTKDREQRPLDT